MLQIGDAIVYVDGHERRHHNAVVIHVWPNYAGTGRLGCNLVRADGDPAKDDSYGRQIVRDTSVPVVSSDDAEAIAIGACAYVPGKSLDELRA